nr:MafI family immunity protein [Rathayibacter agropyri]
MELALGQLLDRLEERFDPEWFSSCREYNEHTEFVLCLETVVDALYDSDARVPALLLDRIHELARIMEMSDRGQNDLRSS